MLRVMLLKWLDACHLRKPNTLFDFFLNSHHWKDIDKKFQYLLSEDEVIVLLGKENYKEAISLGLIAVLPVYNNILVRPMFPLLYYLAKKYSTKQFLAYLETSLEKGIRRWDKKKKSLRGYSHDLSTE